jgi:glycerophosphoryl diester phosphodiesterase
MDEAEPVPQHAHGQPGDRRDRRAQRSVRRWARWAGLAALLALVVVGWPHVQVYRGAAAPAQISEPVVPPLAAAAPGNQVLGVAHNVGNHPRTLAAALRSGAEVIEIDVISVRGRLAAGRVQPVPWLAERLYAGRTLEEGWAEAQAAPVVKLDLQENDTATLDGLAAFLSAQPVGRPVMVSSRDPAALLHLRPRLTGASLLLSLPFPDALQRVRSDPALVDAIDGVTVFHSLVDRGLMQWARANGLVVLAWTVNDGQRVHELLELGVDGITTQNLAVLEALSGR